MLIIPATNGPIINGAEHSPRTNPIACDAPIGPQIYTAIGPNIVEKQPSNKPITRANTIKEAYEYAPNMSADVARNVPEI